MPRSQAAPSFDGLPSKEDILKFLSQQTGKVGKREIVRAFGISGGARIALKRLLKEMETDGSIDRRRHDLRRGDSLPNVVVADVKSRSASGALLAQPVEWDEAQGKPPHIRLDKPGKAFSRGRKPAPQPNVGDRVLVRVTPRTSAEGAVSYQGRVIKLLTKGNERVLGVLRLLPDGAHRLELVDKKQLGRSYLVPQGEELGARDGDLVAVDVLRENRGTMQRARVRERFGAMQSEKSLSLIAIHTHGIPHSFSPAALAEADEAKPAPLEGREDWRDLPLVTIDPPDAKDHDDAVHAAPDDNPENAGGFIITVAIADVAHYVRPGSPLDRDAVERGNSVYFPDRVVPMLPERISNDLCSLRPKEDRPALAVRLVVGANGRKKSHTFHRVMMRSAAKLAYAQAQAAIDGQLDDTTDTLLEGVLKPLWAAYACVKKARDARGPLDLDLPERKLILAKDGTVERVHVPPRLDAHRLIEEFMILANVAAAETLTEKRIPLVFRVHDVPSMEKLATLREFLKTVDISLPKADTIRPQHFNGLLTQVAETEHAHLVNEIVLRTQAQAEYAAENYGHFGLNLKKYAHFTSPIRRYADVIVHRALIRALHLGAGGLPEEVTPEEMSDIGIRISAAERRAMAAERETIERLIAHFLAERVGATFSGRISGVTRSGLFVTLLDTGASGFIPASTLGRDYFAHDERRHMLVGKHTGESYRLGDMVEVQLTEAAPMAGGLRFEMLTEGRTSGKTAVNKRAQRRQPKGKKK